MVTEVFPENFFVTDRRIEAGLNEYKRNREPSLLDASILWRVSVLLIGRFWENTFLVGKAKSGE